MGWIGVDLDGTLAEYNGWKGAGYIGKPIPKMVERVKNWLDDGKDVRIFTARVAPTQTVEDVDIAVAAIHEFCIDNFGDILPITCIKDHYMQTLWDDRCKQVFKNTGVTVEERYHKAVLGTQTITFPISKET